MAEYKMIGLALTRRDRILIAWLNLLRLGGLSPRTWIQAALLAEREGVDLDIGGVYIPPDTECDDGEFLFGDDTVDEVKVRGWSARGTGGEYIVGSVFTMRVTRPAVLRAIEALGSGVKISAYIKALLRRRIRVLPPQPNELPREDDLGAVFYPSPKSPVSCEPPPVEPAVPPVPEKVRKRKKRAAAVKKNTAAEAKEPETEQEKPESLRNPLLSFMR